MAQGRDIYTPAEAPPAGYGAGRYVDSTGCVFLRAGYGGQVVWVPQLTRDRQPICGQPPSLGAPAQTPSAVARVPAPAPVVPAPPAPRRGRVTAVAAPAAEAQHPAAVAPATAPAMTTRNPACPARAPFGQRVRTTDGRSGVLCTARPAALEDGPVRVAEAPPAPQAAAAKAPAPTPAPAAMRTAAAAPAEATPAPDARRVRSDGRVPTTLTAAAGPVAVPEGYERVWDDDRLNPGRARGTLAGVQAMELMWTSTVPRRLIHRPTGRDMTAAFQATAEAGAPVAAGVRVSTRGGGAAEGGVLVQAAAFRDPGNAAAVAARLRTTGVAAGVERSGGLALVVAGPFAGRAAARAALAIVRRAGFADAYLR